MMVTSCGEPLVSFILFLETEAEPYSTKASFIVVGARLEPRTHTHGEAAYYPSELFHWASLLASEVKTCNPESCVPPVCVYCS